VYLVVERVGLMDLLMVEKMVEKMGNVWVE
jgi:hypothetical protein